MQSYRLMKKIPIDSILGKTESAKYVLQYLTESYGAQSGLIEDRINQCQ